jgi:hypothetical protein
MSWRGQGGKRAKGRRGDQDPELDNTAWLAELEREAAQADEDEDDWAGTLRSRRAGGGESPAFEEAPPAGDPGWAGEDPREAAADPDWAWRRPAPDPYDGAPAGPPEADWSDPGTGGWQPAGTDSPTGAWSPADPDSGYAPADPDPGYAPDGPDPGYAAADPDLGYAAADPDPGYARGADPGYMAGPDPAYPAASDPAYPDAPLAGRESNYASGYPEAPQTEPPVGREPDYPALFGELYRRSAGQQDPIWEAPPPVEPLPETGSAEPATGTWPFEETTQSWEPSDRSFIWPSDELPSAPAAWEQPGPAPWDEPAPEPPARHEAADRGLDQTAAWPAPPADPAPRSSPWAGRTGSGNGASAQATGPAGPPPDDWAAAIPTDVPAAERAADPASATRAWRSDDLEPGVPLGPAATPPGGHLGPAATAPPAGGAAARTSRLRGGPGPGTGDPRTAEDPAAGATGAWAGPGAPAGAAGARGGYGAPAGAGTRPNGRADALAGDRRMRDAAAGAGYDTGAGPADDPAEVRRKGPARRQPAGERQARAWPRIVAIISWIVLVMVVCWFYVFPWLERVLPENF